MAWRLDVSCDGCGKVLRDVDPTWFRTGYNGQPSHGIDPYYGTLPDSWQHVRGDSWGDGEAVYCPRCHVVEG